MLIGTAGAVVHGCSLPVFLDRKRVEPSSLDPHSSPAKQEAERDLTYSSQKADRKAKPDPMEWRKTRGIRIRPRKRNRNPPKLEAAAGEAVAVAKNAAKGISDIQADSDLEAEKDEADAARVSAAAKEGDEVENESDKLRNSAIDRLEKASEDSLLAQGLKVLNNSVESLASRAWLRKTRLSSSSPTASPLTASFGSTSPMGHSSWCPQRNSPKKKTGFFWIQFGAFLPSFGQF